MKKISFEEFEEWLEEQSAFVQRHSFFDAQENFETEDVQFHKGDAKVETLSLAPCVVIEGDLDVGNITWEFDCGLLVVTGDLVCETFDTPFNVIVGGNLIAQDICVNSGNDYALCVGGDIHAETFIENGHYTTVGGKLKAPIVVLLHNVVEAEGGIEGNVYEAPSEETLREIFIADVLDDDGYFDDEKFLGAVKAGRNPLNAEA